MTTAADGADDPALYIDPDLRADSHESWVRRLGRALAFLVRCLR